MESEIVDKILAQDWNSGALFELRPAYRGFATARTEGFRKILMFSLGNEADLLQEFVCKG